MVTKKDILTQLNTSNEIAKKIDVLYSQELSEIYEEMATSYEILLQILNREDQSKISDADFQSGFLFWTALNSYLSAIELFRRGYNKEPQMLLRNVIEIFSAAYDIHINPDKLTTLRYKPNYFDSKKSINTIKKIDPKISQLWGQLSSTFSHVSVFHTVPHRTAPFCIGGLFDPKDQEPAILGILPPFNIALDLLNSVLEFTFFDHIPHSRFWEKISSKVYKHSLPKKNIERGKRLMKKMEGALNNFKQRKANK